MDNPHIDWLAARSASKRGNLAEWRDWQTPALGGSGDTTPPTAPTGLAASCTTATGTSLSWTASTDDTGLAGHTLTGSWNGTVTTSGQTVTIRHVAHNGTLAAGARTTSVGFQVSRPSGDALPSGYTCA